MFFTLHADPKMGIFADTILALSEIWTLFFSQQVTEFFSRLRWALTRRKCRQSSLPAA